MQVSDETESFVWIFVSTQAAVSTAVKIFRTLLTKYVVSLTRP